MKQLDITEKQRRKKESKDKYVRNNIEKVRQQKRDYKKRNPNADKEYYKKNKVEFLAQQKIFREENKGIIKERRRIHYAINKEKILLKNKEYREKNKDTISKRESIRNKNTLGIKTKNRRARIYKVKIVKITPTQLRQRMSMYGNKCWMCGGEFEAVDHVIPLVLGGLHVLANLRPACKSCNSKKGGRKINKV